MSRRMIDPSVIIKSQIYDDSSDTDNWRLNLVEVLEKYGVVWDERYRTVTLQVYFKVANDEAQLFIRDDGGNRCQIFGNLSFTITKQINYKEVFAAGLFVTAGTPFNLIGIVEFQEGDYENGIILESSIPFDVHIIRV